MQVSKSSAAKKRLIAGGGILVLLIVMLLNTRFLTAAEVADLGPKPFDPAGAASGLFGRAGTELPGKAKPLSDVLPALQKDLKGAASTYGAVAPTDSSFVFVVTATGTVNQQSTPEALRLDVDGLTGDTPVLVPVTTAINGTVLRDAMGFKFADAPGQSEYQFVGDELKKLILTKAVAPVGDPAQLKGKKVTVLGVMSVIASGGVNTVPAAKPANIQPVKIEVAP